MPLPEDSNSTESIVAAHTVRVVTTMGTQDQQAPWTRWRWVNLVILAGFAVMVILIHLDAPGIDLTSSYIGCRLFVTGQADHLYSYDPILYNKVTDPVWDQAIVGKHLPPPPMILPPYVQTPLWGYLLQPLCRTNSFPAFNKFFLLPEAFCLAGIIWVTARYWTPRLFNPTWIVLLLLGWVFSEPLRYALYLTQTHVIFLFLSLLAILLAHRNRPIGAGVLLALAAAVKITPGLLVIYWLVTRQGKAALSFVVSSAVLLALTIAAVGPHLVLEYLHSMGRVGNILLVSWNNQSLAAWWMGSAFPPAELLAWRSLPLPQAVKLTSLGLLLASGIVGGYLDRRLMTRGSEAPPVGALFTLVAATMLTPIAWTHYYILLIVPVMFFLDENLRWRSWPLLMAAVTVGYLTTVPQMAHHYAKIHIIVRPIVRVQFYAATVTLIGLLLFYVLRLRKVHNERETKSLNPASGTYAG